jgi:anti-sigma regulatory factor (Ser/Thr protein kinase)
MTEADTAEAAPAELHIEREATDIVRARRWLLDLLRRTTPLDAEQLDEAGVMISELVTNVLHHTTSEARIVVSRARDEVRIEVHDEDAAATPVLRPIDPTRTGGNGIRIIQALSTSWGCDLLPDDGKRVWFTLRW